MTARSWGDLTDRQKTLLLTVTSVQLSLAATAWVDLARRPEALVNGRKGIWALVIAVNYLGPLAYFLRGRRAVGAG